MPFTRDYYDLLGVPRSADASTLRRAFHKQSKVFHPDTTSLPSSQAAEKFQLLCEAYDLLIDPKRRKSYDDNLSDQKISEKTLFKEELFSKSSSFNGLKKKEVLRPLSGGELFSLILLGATFFLSLIICLIVLFTKGTEVQILPSWLIADQTFDQIRQVSS
ncbi:J domain-containing protein [Prochlorococcus sp. MIT 1341]|uniref:J domain-containing protein n=1 Tax=Prochlorococcus sp. MIT 1341 TaxID=3096221 RepID=UPI002A750653|nr:J domain-containing protein [Prochlorococcus sp. MIT 1341]